MSRRKTLRRILSKFRYRCGFDEPRAAEFPCYDKCELTGAEARKMLAYIEYLENIQRAAYEFSIADADDGAKELAGMMEVVVAVHPRKFPGIKPSEFTVATAALRKEANEAVAESEQLNDLFDRRWDADMRAVKRWQEATGRKLTHPDHVDLVLFLLEKLEAAEAKIQTQEQPQ